jgi:uncharacterized delta-60 repeat protein
MVGSLLFDVLVGCSTILGFDKSVEDQRTARPDGGDPIDDSGSGPEPADSSLVELRGELDPTFGSGGFVTTTSELVGSTSGYFNETRCGAALDSRRRTIVSCGTKQVSAAGLPDPRTRLFRFDEEGHLDATFGAADGGITFEAFAPYLIRQADDRMLVAGYKVETPEDGSSTRPQSSVLWRLQVDGTLDTSVGVRGNMLTKVSDRDNYALAATVSAGKATVVGGVRWYDNRPFQSPYRAIVDLARAQVEDVAVADDAGVSSFEPIEIVSATPTTTMLFGRQGGSGCEPYVGGACAAIARFVGGKFDPSFGDGGVSAVLVSPHGPANGSAFTEASGSIATLAGGFGTPGVSATTYFARFGADGRLDKTIGDAGLQRVHAPAGYPDAYLVVNAVVPTMKGKILAAGYVIPPTVTSPRRARSFIFRLLPSGDLDTAFGDAGYKELVVGIGKDDSIEALLPQPDGRVLAVGRAMNEQGNWDVFVARFR